MKKFIAVLMAPNLYEITEAQNGRYALAEEAEALEQLNKEMLEVLKAAYRKLTDWKHGGLPKDKQAQIEELLSNIIAKAEEV